MEYQYIIMTPAEVQVGMEVKTAHRDLEGNLAPSPWNWILVAEIYSNAKSYTFRDAGGNMLQVLKTLKMFRRELVEVVQPEPVAP